MKEKKAIKATSGSPRAWLIALLLMTISLPATVAGADSNRELDGTADVSTAVQQLTQPLVSLPPIPLDPVKTLIAAVNAHSASLGFVFDHGPAIRASGMSPAYAGRVALLMQAVLACAGASTEVQKLCAGAASDAAEGVIATAAPFFNDVQAWPNLYIDGNGRNDVYIHDYTVLIDRGGNDLYDNNAGGNLQDIKFGPAAPAPRSGANRSKETSPYLPREHTTV